MASARQDVVKQIYRAMEALQTELTPVERLQVLERLLGVTLCSEFIPEHEDQILHEIVARITAVNAKIRKELEQEAALSEQIGDPGTGH